jgi:hypothetical protein
VNGVPDDKEIQEDFGSLIEQTAATANIESPRVAIFGEGGALLCADGHTDTALLMERIGNDMVKRHKIEILCAYPLTEDHPGIDRVPFTGICAEHTAVLAR